MLKLRIFLLGLLIFLLVGCNEAAEKKKETVEKPKVNNPLQGYVNTMDKAKDAQKKVKEAAEKQRKAIEEATENKKKQPDNG